MKILFTRNNSILSRLIRSVTGEPVSHCAIQMDYVVIHSNLLGVHLEFADNFREHSEVIYELENTEADWEKFNKFHKYEFSFYDLGALFFLGISFALRNWFDLPLPKSNLWQASGLYLCTEFIQKSNDLENDAMITPYKEYLRLRSLAQWNDVQK